jgi:hypothetical protein
MALDRVIDASEGTEFGREHGLRAGLTLEAYRRQVPVRTSSEYQVWLDRAFAGPTSALVRFPVIAWNKTSGTMGAPRLLPVTAPWAAEVGRAQRVWVVGMVAEQPSIAAPGAAAWSVVGPAIEGRTPGGTPIGANAGRMAAAQPWWVRIRQPIPGWLADLPDPELRGYLGLRLALAHDVRVWTTANPTTFLYLMRLFNRYRAELEQDLADGTAVAGPAGGLAPGDRRRLSPWVWRRRIPKDPRGIGAYWRNLAAVNCWRGGQAAWFVPKVLAGLAPAQPLIREVGISASEGHLGVALHSSWDGGVVAPGGALVEFFEEEGTEPREAADLQVGERVKVVLSTTAGLYRYDLGDLLEVVGRWRATPIVRFVRRVGETSSLTGEKLTSDQVWMAGERLGWRGRRFVLVAVLDEVPYYRLAWEASPDEDGPVVASRFDAALTQINVEYASKRSSGRLGPIVAVLVPTGGFDRWRHHRHRSGVADGQLKERVLLDPAGWEDLTTGWGDGLPHVATRPGR